MHSAMRPKSSGFLKPQPLPINGILSEHKTNPLSYIALFLLILAACHKDCGDPTDPVRTACMLQKIEEFKLDSHSISIIKIKQPGNPQYWFRTTLIALDVGENIYDSDCNVTCNNGCFCPEDFLCDESLFDFPKEIIWEK